MRNVKWIFVVLFIFSLTAFVDKDKATSGLSVGDTAPDFTFKTTSDSETSANLSDLRGHYVLISFWASYDAQSRIDNVLLNNSLQSNGENVKLVSISFDKFESVFEETIRKDQIEASVCYTENKGENSRLFKKYRLDRGFTNYLLDENGVIIAKNISAKELSSYLEKQI